MAVSPTDDGALGAASASRTSTLTLLTAAAVVVIVACLGVLGYRLVNDTDEAAPTSESSFDATERDLAMSVASQFVLRINTYGPGQLDENNKMPTYTSEVLEVITPKLAVSFNKQVTLAEQTVSKSGVARAARVFATAVDTIDADSASVLFAGSFGTSYPNPRTEGRIQIEPQPLRLAVSLVKIDGDWLVDDFVPLTGEVPEQPATGGQGSGPTGGATP